MRKLIAIGLVALSVAACDVAHVESFEDGSYRVAIEYGPQSDERSYIIVSVPGADGGSPRIIEVGP